VRRLCATHTHAFLYDADAEALACWPTGWRGKRWPLLRVCAADYFRRAWVAALTKAFPFASSIPHGHQPMVPSSISWPAGRAREDFKHSVRCGPTFAARSATRSEWARDVRVAVIPSLGLVARADRQRWCLSQALDSEGRPAEGTQPWGASTCCARVASSTSSYDQLDVESDRTTGPLPRHGPPRKLRHPATFFAFVHAVPFRVV